MYIECNTKYIKSTFTLTVKVLTVKSNRFDSHLGYACERACTRYIYDLCTRCSWCIQTLALRKPNQF